ncbi:RAS protein activator like-3 isoform X3 [Cygnus atratus]|uniref:RAS protein activator like-3 isoform X3 n=2 Tax=Cygnus atratus TaxID=8868 RepID=UPI0015D64352|nr:RAS protein activator like-3 isoform X3 [Cygnus atratus]
MGKPRQEPGQLSPGAEEAASGRGTARLGGPQMEVEKPPVAAETPTLLKTYKWRTAAPLGDREPERGTGSPGSRRWTRLQGWKRSYSQPESDGPDDGAGKGAPKASTRRSLFQRAFSAPSKVAKEPRSPEGGKATLQKYLRSMSKRKGHGESGARAERAHRIVLPTPESTHGTPTIPLAPALDVPVWDVSNFSLVDGQLIHVGRDEEASWRSRNRTGSSISESTSLHPGGGRRDTDPAAEERNTRAAGKGTDSDASATSQFSNVKGLLWKRLRDRKGRAVPKTEMMAVADGERTPSQSGSHESLLPPPSAAELDLTGDNVIIRPVHGSIVGEKFCFQIITGEGSRSFGCTSLAERDRWIENLRRTVQPNKDNCERLELALSLWVYEARDLPPRRRLRCHLHLDGVLFARTTAKVAGPDGELFWGELFQLAALPPARALTLALCRDDQGHPCQTVASVTVPLAELAAARQPLERWYPLSGHSSGERAPSVRVRGRYREVRVLPIVRYKELAEFITFHYRELCAHLEPTIAVRHKEELAGALVHVLQSTGKAKAFLVDLGVAELDRFDDREALIFRENTLATKAIDEYMKLVGGKYLQDTLGEALAQLCTSDDSCEVDPSKCAGPDLSDNQNNLRQVCEETFQRIATSCEAFPAELGEIFAAWQEECAARGKVAIGQRLVSASLFLRFLCPAIMSPSLFGLVQEYPSEATARTLTLVAKVIQNLANFTTFGEKEAYMGFMNEFLEHNWSTMTAFLQSVANPESSVHMATYDGYVDLALELATLHLLLCDIFSSLDQATQEELEPLPTILNAIREGTPVPVSVRLSSTTERSLAESHKPGFVPPRDLSKHSPLIKSQSLISIRRVRSREDGTEVEPARAPSPRPSRERRNVQRTQSVPAQNKAGRRVRKQSSAEHVAEPQGEDTPGSSGPRDATGRSKLRSSVSLPRKSTVPWQRYAEEAAAAQGELYAICPLEKHGRLIEALGKEVAESREKLRLAEVRAGELEAQHRGLRHEQGQHREQLERLHQQLEEANARLANLGARLTAAEGTRKKDLERLKASEEKGRALESRLLALERENAELRGAIAQVLGHPGRTGCRPPGTQSWDEGGEDAQATSV